MNLLVSRKKLLGNTGDFLWSYGGYLIVSTLCDLCGVVLDESNTRNFVSGCIESLHDILKSNLNIDGVNYVLSLNDELISEFIDFYLSVGGRKYLYDNGDECTDITGGYITDKLQLYAQTTYPIKLEDHIQLRTNHDSSIHTMAGIESTNKIDFNALFIQGYKNIKSDIEFVNAIDSVNNYSRILLLNQVMSSDYKNPPNANYYDFDVKMSLGRVDNYVGRKIVSAELNSDLTSHFIGAYTSMMKSTTLEAFMNIYSIYLEKQYNISDSYVKSLEEYKAKYENEPSRIILNSSMANVKTKWKKEDTNIYIPDGNVESLPSGMNVTYRKYLINDGHINVRWGCGSFVYTDETAGLFSTDENGDKYLDGGYQEIHTVDAIDLTGKTKICLDWIGYNRGVFLYREDGTKIREVPGADIGREWGKRRYTELALGDIGKLGLCKIYIERYSQGDRCMLYKVWLE